jgi:hypothetical protein
LKAAGEEPRVGEKKDRDRLLLEIDVADMGAVPSVPQRRYGTIELSRWLEDTGLVHTSSQTA